MLAYFIKAWGPEELMAQIGSNITAYEALTGPVILLLALSP